MGGVPYAGLSEKNAGYQDSHRGHGLGHAHGQGLDDDSYVTGTMMDGRIQYLLHVLIHAL